MSSSHRRIVYLFGAGASQAEASLVNPEVQILMNDLSDAIALRIKKEGIAIPKEVSNQLLSGVDIEQIMTLFESAGTSRHQQNVSLLRNLFRKVILERIDELGMDFSPRLLPALVDMHQIPGLNEDLVAMMTLNYEDFLEKAIVKIKGGINYEILVDNDLPIYKIDSTVFPLLKLHGSFNWKNQFPVSIIPPDQTASAEDVLWIPPGVEKRREKYPFNLIWGKAREMLTCDTLRIVGCSLSRNDWELISLLHFTQHLNESGTYHIELIDYPTACNDIEGNYRYLKINKILDDPAVRSYLIDQYFPELAELSAPPDEVIKELTAAVEPPKYNIFDIWLTAKGEDLLSKDIPIETERNIFKAYMEKG